MCVAIVCSVDLAQVASTLKCLEKQFCCHQYTYLHRDSFHKENVNCTYFSFSSLVGKVLLPAIQAHCGMNFQYFKLANTEQVRNPPQWGPWNN